MDEIYDNYEAITNVMRPPVMNKVQMQRCLLHITGDNRVVYLPTGKVKPFDEMRRWVGWTWSLRTLFDEWASDPNRKQIVAPKIPIPYGSTGEFQLLGIRL